RLQIVRRDFRRRDYLSIFARKGFLDAAIKEISDVRIFFRFGDAQLRFAGGTHDLAKDVNKIFRREHEWRRISRVVFGERSKMNSRPNFAIEGIEVFEDEGLR